MDSSFYDNLRKRLQYAESTIQENRLKQQDDLKFFAATPDNPEWQWEASILQSRSGAASGTSARPTLVINKLAQHAHQISNGIIQDLPAIKVIPVSDKADFTVAQNLDGMMKHIEYRSSSDIVYGTACQSQVVTGEGFFRILTDYVSPDSFDQEILLGRIKNSFCVVMDPDINDPTGLDAKYCYILTAMSKEDFKKLYPNATDLSSFDSVTFSTDLSVRRWFPDEGVVVAEYFYKDEKDDTLCWFETPNITIYKSNKTQYQLLVAQHGEPTKTRPVKKEVIKWIKTNGFETLAETDWPGKYIPLVRVVGDEVIIDGNTYSWGIIRPPKDAQRMYNYWKSLETELIALAPKAPFIGYAGQFENFEERWRRANIENYAYLEVNPDVTDENGRVLPLPQRAQPPMPQTAINQAALSSSEDIKATTGQYDASLGQVSNERSAAAINARDRQVDIGTYHFRNNLGHAIRSAGKIILDLIPHIYDTKRVVMIVKPDGDHSKVGIDPELPTPYQAEDEEQGIKEALNPNIGIYDVCITTGPSYLTKRQEDRESLIQLVQAYPDLMKVGADILIGSMDFSRAHELAKRLQPASENPQLQAAQQQIEQMGQELNALHGALKNVQNSFEAQDLTIKEQEVQIKQYDAETKRIATLNQIQPFNEDQIQQMVLGTIHAMVESGDMIHLLNAKMGNSMSGEVQEEAMEPQQGVQI